MLSTRPCGKRAVGMECGALGRGRWSGNSCLEGMACSTCRPGGRTEAEDRGQCESCVVWCEENEAGGSLKWCLDLLRVRGASHACYVMLIAWTLVRVAVSRAYSSGPRSTRLVWCKIAIREMRRARAD